MTNVWTPANLGRVEKITDLLDKMTSNKADQSVMVMLLAPVVGKIEQMTGAPAPVPVNDHTKRRDITLWNEAQTAPLAELMLAYTTITSRLTDLVDERKKP